MPVSGEIFGYDQLVDRDPRILQVPLSDRGEPAVNYRSNRLKSKTARKLPIILEECIQYASI
jgi:hypothetical protein